MKKKLIITLLNCTLILLAATSFVFGQEKEIDLKDKKITMQVENKPLATVFKILIENYDVPIGFEEAELDRDHNNYNFEISAPFKPIRNLPNGIYGSPVNRMFKAEKNFFTVKVENEDLENVLDIIIEQMPNYKWEINDGVVNIFPAKGRSKIFEELLELKITKFTLQKGFMIGFLRDKVLILPEVEKFLAENNLDFDYYRDRSADSERFDKTFDNDLKYSNITFRELLNKITKDKRGGWILKMDRRYNSKESKENYIDKEKEYIDIDI